VECNLSGVYALPMECTPRGRSVPCGGVYTGVECTIRGMSVQCCGVYSKWRVRFAGGVYSTWSVPCGGVYALLGKLLFYVCTSIKL